MQNGTPWRPRATPFIFVVALTSAASTAKAELAHDSVSGAAIARVTLRNPNGQTSTVGWESLTTPKAPGVHTLRFLARGDAVMLPHCNGRERVFVDDQLRDPGARGPLVVRLTDDRAHEVAVEVKVSAYEKRIACSEPPRVGPVVNMTSGLSRLRFASPHAARGGGEAVVFVPGGHDPKKPATVLVGTHPWNGSPWTYAAYTELLEEAGRKDVVLLMPNGLGNSLYVADAEDEVMRSLDALGNELAIDRQRVSIWGASMGGAGATTIAFHRPDRFAFVASFFGDSAYDLTTYVKGILGGEAGAHRVNALDVVENARHLPVLLVHGEEDRTSPMKQSTLLEAAMRRAGLSVELERVFGMGHEGPLVTRHVRRVVDRAAAAVAPARPSRVSFRSVRPSDAEAYGVRIVRAGEGDAFVDLERVAGEVRVHAARGVSTIELDRDALGGENDPFPPVRFDPDVTPVSVRRAR